MNNALSIEALQYSSPFAAAGNDASAAPATPPTLHQSGRSSDFISKLKAWALANTAALVDLPRSEPTKPFRATLFLVGDKTAGNNLREDLYLVNAYNLQVSAGDGTGVSASNVNGSFLLKLGTHFSVCGTVEVTNGRGNGGTAHYFGATSTWTGTGLGAAMGIEPVAFPSVSNGFPAGLNLRDVGPFTHLLRVFGTGDVANAGGATSCNGLHLRWS